MFIIPLRIVIAYVILNINTFMVRDSMRYSYIVE